MTDRSFDDNGDWTAEERERLAAVGRHRSPRAELKSRTMGALRDQDLIGAERRGWPRRTIGLAAAAVVVFAGGVLTGYGVAHRATDQEPANTAAASATREVARADTVPPAASNGRHVVWF